MQRGKQQIKSFDNNKEIPIDGTNKIFICTYIMSAFRYCPLIWMFFNKISNNQINKTYKRTLRLVYEMQDVNFENLLLKDISWNVHESNMRTLLIEIYKSISNLSPPIMKDFFDLKNTRYDL